MEGPTGTLQRHYRIQYHLGARRKKLNLAINHLLQPTLYDGGGFVKDEGTGEIHPSSEVKVKAQEALLEWAEPLVLIQRIECGMISLSLSEYDSLPKVFMDIWGMYIGVKNEIAEKAKEHAKRNT